jgi:hypothetical protein
VSTVSDIAKIRGIIQAVVSEVLETQVPAVRESIVGRVTAEMKTIIAASAGNSASDLLKNAVFTIQEATTQTEILRALLDGTANFCGRAGLFVLRGNVAVGWQARGFRDNDAIRILSVDANTGVAGRAIQQRVAASGLATQFDARFASGFGTPLDGNCFVLPLIIRERAAALLYCDSGLEREGEVDSSALELLVRSAATWIELLGLRRSVTAASTSMPAQPRHDAQVAPQPAARAQAAGEGRESTASPAVETSTVQSLAPYTRPRAADAESAPAAHVSVADAEEIHRKARRFAKLLVEEIILYNKDKVAEGRVKRDLYNRLKDDIDKSRATYDKRYAQTPAAAGDYFTQELISTLAANDSSLLGSSFSG